MKRIKENITFLDCKYKNCSTFGNPSYYVYFEDSAGNFCTAYTASNAACGYCIRNYKQGDKLQIEYHYTRNNNLIIDYIKSL